MIANPCGKLELLVSQLFQNAAYLMAIEEGLSKYRIKCYNLTSIRPNTVLETYYQISHKFYTNNMTGRGDNWHENQLKIYIWLLVGYVFIKKLTISQLTDEDWLFFSDIFKNRTPLQLQYQALLLLKNHVRNQKWEEEEIGLLKNLMNKNQRKNMWNDVARNLYVVSERKYFRSSKQCREYWINHLSPALSKLPWKYREDFNLIQWAYKNNKKWSRVSRLFNGERTQHMVKNRFNSLYHFQLKKYPSSGDKVGEEQVMSKLKEKLRYLMSEEEKGEKFVKTITDLECEQVMKNLEQKQLSYLYLPPQPQTIRKETTSYFNSDRSGSSQIYQDQQQPQQQPQDNNYDQEPNLLSPLANKSNHNHNIQQDYSYSYMNIGANGFGDGDGDLLQKNQHQNYYI